MLIRREKLLRFLRALLGLQRAKGPLQFVTIILLHIIGWVLFFASPILFYRVEPAPPELFIKECINKGFLIGLFYLNYFYLLPVFFEKRRFFSYVLLITSCLLVLVVEQSLLEKYVFRHFSQPENLMMRMPADGNFPEIDSARHATFSVSAFGAPAMIGGPMISMEDDFFLGMPQGLWFIILSNVASSVFLLVFFGAFIRLTHTLLKHEGEKKAMENAQLNAEVNLLKSQINPHFLFNTLNSIYAQAHARSGNTEYSVLKLSEIFRYVLYDSASERISLQKDLEYINNYIQLQRLRIASKVEIKYFVEGETDNLEIAPLLLITFIENAFKYGVSYARPSVIEIGIKIAARTLMLHVSNPIAMNEPHSETGIGLRNAKRRLELLYPGRYNLQIADTKDRYTVNLKIQLP